MMFYVHIAYKGEFPSNNSENPKMDVKTTKKTFTQVTYSNSFQISSLSSLWMFLLPNWPNQAHLVKGKPGMSLNRKWMRFLEARPS